MVETLYLEEYLRQGSKVSKVLCPVPPKSSHKGKVLFRKGISRLSGHNILAAV